MRYPHTQNHCSVVATLCHMIAGHMHGSMATTLGTLNPLTYRGYVYDHETGLYYLQSRYYNPEWGRFINSDVFAATGQGLIGNNMFVYCGNNPVSRSDDGGCFWDIVFDVASLVMSVIEVVNNPTDVGAWVGLACDVIDVAVPCVGGLGEAARAVDTALEAADTVLDVADTVVDTADTIHDVGNFVDVGQIATKGTSNEIGRIGEQLAGIDPGAKVSIQVNGRTRIPDALTETTLTEVKNVKYISNTRQLRDFADYAKATGRTLELYVRPTTKVAKTVIDAGWDIRYLW